MRFKLKIEKLTENKLRIIMRKDDFKEKNINLQAMLNKSEDLQKFFWEIITQAQKEFDFSIDGYKLLIEGFSSDNEIYIFTITKYIDTTMQKQMKENKSNRKKLTIKKKNEGIVPSNQIYSFNDFEDFCCVCNLIQDIKPHLKGVSKESVLYLYNDTYFLTFTEVNVNHPYFKAFSSYIAEFATRRYFSKNYETKMKEHGTVIIKKNALNVGIKYFSGN